LEGILKILKELRDPGLIRVGGRGKCEALEEFSLNKKRITASRMKFFDSGYYQAKKEATFAVRDLEFKRAAILGEVVALGNLEGKYVIFLYVPYSSFRTYSFPYFLLQGLLNSDPWNVLRN